MRLLGYVRNHGTSKKTGKEFDFVKLLVEECQEKEGAECGGVQWVVDRYTYDLPTVPTEIFLKALKSGIHVGDEIELYRDFKNNAVLRKA